jgi:DNA/RNA-binding domain of Phe-tRNA-synthetase-like protein
MREGPVIDAGLAEDFPSLAVLYATRAVGGRDFARAARERLTVLSDRVSGDLVLAIPQQAVPGALRAFARQVGLDPDADGLPMEQLLMQRLRAGRFLTAAPVGDACAVAMLETGVPVWAIDEDRLRGPLRIGAVVGPDVARPESRAVQPGELAVWDARRPVAVLLGSPAPDVTPARRTRRVRLFALRVEGVPDASVREALWTAAELTGPRA